VSKKLPFVTSDIPRDLRSFLDRMRELVSGSGPDRLLTANDLASSGLATVDGSGVIRPTSTFVATPPPPTTVTATAAIRNIIVAWDNPAYVGHAYAEVWRSSTSSQSAAVLLGMSPGAIYVDEVGPSATRYYWVRFVNTDNTPGPYNALVGVSATTGSDVTYTVGLLAGQITTTQLATALNNRIDLIDGSAAVPGTIPNQLAQIQGQIDAITSYPDYDNGTTYAADDIVKYNGGLYKAISTTTGNLPTNATYWLKIGDYSSLADIVAAHTSEIATLTTDLGGEVTSRQALATQMRGTYTGTDVASVTAGLIFSEKTARTTADTGLASDISVVAATASSKTKVSRQTTAPTSPSVNDIWVDTRISYNPDYFAGEYATPKYKQYQWTGTEWLDITDSDISDNFGSITREQLARASADSALAEDILTLNTYFLNETTTLHADLQIERETRIEDDIATTLLFEQLDSQVNNIDTGLPATRATLINDYSTTATVNSAIASSKTALRAYTNTSASRTFRQATAPTKRGVDADTSLDIPLQNGDVWVDTDDLNKLYLWTGSAWVYSPDGAITGSVTSLTATLTNDYLTATDTENAIAQSGTFLRAYADVQSKVFRTADAPTKRGVDPEDSADIPLLTGDVWYDTNDSNKLYLWSGSAWVYSPDAEITGSVTAVAASISAVETTKIGYCTIGGLATDDTNRAACEAAGGTWNVGIPIATAVKQVNVSDGADSATLEQRFTAQKTLNDGLKLQYTIKLDVNGNVAGYGIYAGATTSEFIANVGRFAVTTPQSLISLRTTNTAYAQGAIARVAGQDSKTLVCKIGGSTGAGALTVGNIGTLIVDGSVTWQVSSRVPLAVQAVPTQINGQDVPAGIYFDAGYILNATIQNAQIADLAVDDAKIVSLGVAKLTAGSVAVGEYIQSTDFVTGSAGWRIDGNGTAEFAAASIRGQLTASQINANGLSIRDTDGNIILNAGTANFTGSVAGTAASTLVTTANNAASAASTAQGTANSAVSAASTAQGTANSAVSAASTAQGTANAAVSGLANKLNSNAQNVLAGAGGLSVGTLTWNSSGTRTGGYGIGFSAGGLAAFNSSGVATFALDGESGSAFFGGDITAGTVGGSSVGTNYVRSANYVSGSSGWEIDSNGDAEFNQLTVRSGQVTGALLKAVKINSFSGIYVEISGGVPVSTTSGPYYLNGFSGSYINSPPQYLVGYYTMPAPETASHKIAAVINVQSQGSGTNKDLAVLLLANASAVGDAIYGEQVAYNTNSGVFGLATNGAGVTSNSYSTATTFAVFVGGFNAAYTIQNIDGILFGVR
jgi:hypothetical protein